MHLAYLNSQYPALSHTFIEREVQSVRLRGIDVRTVSIRRPSTSDVLSDNHRQASEETTYVMCGLPALIWTVVSAFCVRPLNSIRTCWAGQVLSPAGPVSRLKHLAYAIEALRLARLMRQEGLSHVHVHMANNAAMVALLATRFDQTLSYSLTVHGSADFYEVHELRLRQKGENAIFVRCISDFCRAQVMAWSGSDVWDRIYVVHCGVDPNVYQLAEHPAGSPLRLLTVGRLVPIKGYPILLRACRQLVDEGIDVRLEMVGDGPMRENLEQLAGNLAIRDRVLFAGPIGQDDIQAYYDRANVMVISSFMEGVPVVLMEAMAKGLAVVATRVGGIAELVEEGVSGWLVNPASVDALVRGIRQAATHRDHLAAMGRAGRRRVIEEFSIDDVGSSMASLFKQYVTDGVAESTAVNAHAGAEPALAQSEGFTS